MRSWWMLLVVTLCLTCCLGVQAAPSDGASYWAARVGNVSQQMGRYARLALERSQNPTVLANASRVLGESNFNLKRLAGLEELSMSTGPTGAQGQEFQTVAQLKGPDFDRAYWQKQQDATTALNLCLTQALARSHDAALTRALSGMEVEAAGR